MLARPSEEIRIGGIAVRFRLEGEESGGSVALFEFGIYRRLFTRVRGSLRMRTSPVSNSPKLPKLAHSGDTLRKAGMLR